MTNFNIHRLDITLREIMHPVLCRESNVERILARRLSARSNPADISPILEQYRKAGRNAHRELQGLKALRDLFDPAIQADIYARHYRDFEASLGRLFGITAPA